MLQLSSPHMQPGPCGHLEPLCALQLEAESPSGKEQLRVFLVFLEEPLLCSRLEEPCPAQLWREECVCGARSSPPGMGLPRPSLVFLDERSTVLWGCCGEGGAKTLLLP